MAIEGGKLYAELLTQKISKETQFAFLSRMSDINKYINKSFCTFKAYVCFFFGNSFVFEIMIIFKQKIFFIHKFSGKIKDIVLHSTNLYPNKTVNSFQRLQEKIH